MSGLSDDFLAIADQVSTLHTQFLSSEAFSTAQELEAAAGLIGKAHSGSWWGYHARVYYKDFASPPDNATFSVEWGLIGGVWESSTGDWQQYSSDYTYNYILSLPGKKQVDDAQSSYRKIFDEIPKIKDELMSLFSIAVDSDSYMAKLQKEVELTNLISKNNYINGVKPSGNVMSRDTTALTAGMQVPPHVSAMAEAVKLKSLEYVLRRLTEISNTAAKHIQRKSRSIMTSLQQKDCIFIGHGRSTVWVTLRDFIRDRLRIDFEEFSREPTAGMTTVERLQDMLNKSTFAFLIMTAEDETPEGTVRARMNVVHEVGLFQGKLGFRKAIVLLEEGCEEFSNIHGLTQIRFPKGNITAVTEELRRVLEREGIIRG